MNQRLARKMPLLYFQRLPVALFRGVFTSAETSMGQRRHLRRAIIISLFCTGAAVGALRADLIYFRSGGEIQVPATVEGGRVVVAMPDGKVAIAPDLIRQRVPGYWPAAEWGTRNREARRAGFGARLAAVWWAIENGLTTEAAAEVRELHALDPKNAQTARMAAVLDRLDRPCSDQNFGAFEKALGIETKVARGPHVLLLHQHSDDEASERIDLLERVIAGYYLMFAAQGLELSVPRSRLMSAWFADKKDYLAFLHSQGADPFATTRGYYHPTWKAVVAFDARSTPEHRASRDKIAAQREELAQYSEVVDRAPAGSRAKVQLGGGPARTLGRTEAKTLIQRLDGEATCELLMLDYNRRAIDLGTAAHEMIHQLAAASALSGRYDAFPIWLQEGLAAQFEVIRGGRWAGISRAHDLRLPDWRKVQTPLPLERLVRDAGFGHGYQRDLYAQAWALVYYLRTQRPQEFLTFIDLLRSPGSSESASAASRRDPVLGAFERAFGTDLAAVERDWRNFMGTVRTPLEQQAPAPDSATKNGRTATGGRNRKSETPR